MVSDDLCNAQISRQPIQEKLWLVTNRSPNRKWWANLVFNGGMLSAQMQHLGGILGISMLQQET